MKNIGNLRLMNEFDLDQVRLWRNHESIRKNMYKRHIISEKEHKAWWEKIRDSRQETHFIYEYQGVPQGFVSFGSIDMINEHCSWAFYASPNSIQGNGFKIEFLALEYAFFEIKVKKLYCEVLEFNNAVIKLHQKFGFKVDGVLRKHHRYNESLIDVHVLSILKDEWLNLRDVIGKRIDKVLND